MYVYLRIYIYHYVDAWYIPKLCQCVHGVCQTDDMTFPVKTLCLQACLSTIPLLFLSFNNSSDQPFLPCWSWNVGFAEDSQNPKALQQLIADAGINSSVTVTSCVALVKSINCLQQQFLQLRMRPMVSLGSFSTPVSNDFMILILLLLSTTTPMWKCGSF